MEVRAGKEDNKDSHLSFDNICEQVCHTAVSAQKYVLGLLYRALKDLLYQMGQEPVM